jgi:hypothetical protein
MSGTAVPALGVLLADVAAVFYAVAIAIRIAGIGGKEWLRGILTPPGQLIAEAFRRLRPMSSPTH